MIEVFWTKGAFNNLKNIFKYYTEADDEKLASGVLQKIERSIIQLRQFPKLGRPGRVEGTRELFVTQTPFAVIYRESDTKLEIVRILHSSQKWPLSN